MKPSSEKTVNRAPHASLMRAVRSSPSSGTSTSAGESLAYLVEESLLGPAISVTRNSPVEMSITARP